MGQEFVAKHPKVRKVLSHSELGKRIHEGDQEIQSLLDLTEEQMAALHVLLNRNSA